MKNILLIVSFIITCTALSSQSQSKYAGVRAGANLSSTEPKGIGPKTKMGYHAGAFYHWGIGEKTGFQPELLYSTKGYRTERNVRLTDEVGELISQNGKLELKGDFSIVEVPYSFTLGKQTVASNC